MHHAPRQERLDVYRYSLAAESWAQARFTIQKAQQIEKKPTIEGANTAYSLHVAFYILYGRPFKQRPSLRIDKEIVPEAFMNLHEGIIVLRDKMFAHSDEDLVSSVGDPINTVVVDVKVKSLGIGVTTLKPLEASGLEYVKLLDQIIKTAVYRRDKIFRRWSRHLSLQFGTRWLINFGADSDEVLKATTKEPRVFAHTVREKSSS